MSKYPNPWKMSNARRVPEVHGKSASKRNIDEISRLISAYSRIKKPPAVSRWRLALISIRNL
jgi:hypothetical protein